MATESEKIGEEAGATPPSEEKKSETTTPSQENPEVKAEEEKIAKLRVEHENLQKAVDSEKERLRETRKQTKTAKQGTEDELPKIDLEDPSAKAWDKRIQDTVAPANLEIERAKEERRLYTLKQFLSDKPSLAKNPERIKSMMETYDRLKTSTELTNEGILMDLEKAYAAEHSEELISAARQARMDDARNDAIFSDIAVSKGSTAYSTEKSKPRVYTDEQKAVLARWNMTPEEHAKIDAEMKAKVE